MGDRSLLADCRLMRSASIDTQAATVGWRSAAHRCRPSLCCCIDRFASEWMWQYTHERPNMGLGGMTPKQRLLAAAESLLLTRVNSGDCRRVAQSDLCEKIVGMSTLHRRKEGAPTHSMDSMNKQVRAALVADATIHHRPSDLRRRPMTVGLLSRTALRGQCASDITMLTVLLGSPARPIAAASSVEYI